MVARRASEVVDAASIAGISRDEYCLTNGDTGSCIHHTERSESGMKREKNSDRSEVRSWAASFVCEREFTYILGVYIVAIKCSTPDSVEYPTRPRFLEKERTERKKDQEEEESPDAVLTGRTRNCPSVTWTN